MPELPNLVIIGAAKSASTFLQNSLDRHPEIFFSPGEVPFFESPDYEQTDLTYLKSLFIGRNEKYLGLKRSTYIGRPEVPNRIKKDLPDAKLLAVLRNPIDRAIAHYFHNMRFGLLPFLPAETGLKKILDDKKYSLKNASANEILECGLYAKYLEKYDYNKKNYNMLVMLQENLLHDKKQSLNYVCAFLGLSEAFLEDPNTGRPQKVIYSLKRIRFSRIFNIFYYKYNNSRTRLFQRKSSAFISILKKLEKSIDLHFEKMKMSDNRTLSLELQNRLVEYYRSDINKLEVILKKDLQHWLSVRS
jgi:hypothetical protein